MSTLHLEYHVIARHQGDLVAGQSVWRKSWNGSSGLLHTTLLSLLGIHMISIHHNLLWNLSQPVTATEALALPLSITHLLTIPFYLSQASIDHAFLTAALGIAVCHIMCIYSAQTGLHANIHCNKSLIWFGFGFWSNISTGPLPPDILLLSRVRLILQLLRASSRFCANSWLQHTSLPSMSASPSRARLDLCACSLQTTLQPPLLSVS